MKGNKDATHIASSTKTQNRIQIMLNYNPLYCLPSSEELPDSDETLVDNQLQHLIPGLLEAILALLWGNRWDWYFGVDMGIYTNPNQPAIVPDGFLSLGVHRC